MLATGHLPVNFSRERGRRLHRRFALSLGGEAPVGLERRRHPFLAADSGGARSAGEF